MIENEGLKREIGTWGLVANSINIIIGAGIFILPAIVSERLGTGSLLAYLVCGLLMLMIMLCFAEVGTRITITGGAYSYIETAFGRYAGFLTTNIFIFGAAVMANAAVANGLADTLSYFFPIFKQQWIRMLFFALMFGGLAYFNIRGIARAMAIVRFNTIAKLIPLLMISVLGWFFIKSSDITITFGNSFKDIGEISLILLFAFVGAETALNVSGEIKNPEKTIPKGILISILIVVVLYILIQIVVQAILGESITEHRDAPLAESAKIMFGTTGALIVIIGAAFSMFGNISGMVLNMPRVLYAAARDRVIPLKSMAGIHPVFRTPHKAIIIYSILGFAFASTGEFRQLAMLSSASYLLIYLGVAISVIRFRFSKNSDKTYYRNPGGILVPVITTFSIIWILSNLPKDELTGMAFFIAVISLIYIVIRLVGRKSSSQKV
ncbi:MAG TPA: amino acid permease [Bacteroidales bacterium]|jgi:basic amino acid/polyamine antiporter, APA family|nr:amino acid permease [Bacteroidales bacterium]